MGTSHVVQQGEHLTSIAAQHGFNDFTVVWNHPDNADLKQLRVNPNVLLPGDTVVIPDKEEKDEPGETTKRHTFTLAAKPLMLRLVLEDAYEKPIANAPCDLFLDGQKTTVTSSAEGKIEQRIAAGTTSVTLVVGTEETPHQGDQMAVGVGQLDPVDTLTGQASRLNNLGYFAGTPEASDDPQFQSALQEFQCEEKLTVDGVAGPLTQAKLKKVHGC